MPGAFDTFQNTFNTSMQLLLKKKAMDQEAQQFQAVMGQKKMELAQEAEQAKQSVAAEALKNRFGTTLEMYKMGQTAGDPNMVNSAGRELERLGVLTGTPINLPKDETGSYVVLKAAANKMNMSGEMSDFVKIHGRGPESDKEWSAHLKTYANKTRPPSESINYFVTPQGVVGAGNKTGKTVTPTVDGKPIEDYRGSVDFASEKTTAETKAKADVEYDVQLKTDFPKVTQKINRLDRQWGLVESKIDDAIEKVSPYTAGAGSWVAVIPATPQRDLRETLETIKANIGFETLRDMREESKTGGAVGQVSDFENRLMQAVEGSLDQGQSPAQLRKNLADVKDLLGKTKEYTKSAYSSQYGKLLESKQQEDPLGIRK